MPKATTTTPPDPTSAVGSGIVSPDLPGLISRADLEARFQTLSPVPQTLDQALARYRSAVALRRDAKTRFDAIVRQAEDARRELAQVDLLVENSRAALLGLAEK